MWIFNHQICDYEWIEWQNPKKSLPPNVHQMNSDESRLLRKLMSETGMSEKEIRAIKKYRKLLSDAQKSGEIQKSTERQKYIKMVMKIATKELKLAKEHPLVIERFNQLMDERRKSPYYPYFMIGV